jgi:hypothetical protein
VAVTRSRCELDCPDEGAELPRYGRHGDLRLLPATHEPRVASAETMGGGARDRRYLGGLVRHLFVTALRVAVGPGCLDEDAAHEAVAGLREPASSLGLSARMLTRHEARVRHELSRALEAADVPKLHEQDHGAQRRNAAETAEARDAVSKCICRGNLCDLLVEQADASIEILDLLDVVLEREASFRVVEDLAADPAPVFLTPPSGLGEVTPVPEQEHAEAVSRSRPILSYIVASPDQITCRFLARSRNEDGRQLTSPKQSRELSWRLCGPS